MDVVKEQFTLRANQWCFSMNGLGNCACTLVAHYLRN